MIEKLLSTRWGDKLLMVFEVLTGLALNEVDGKWELVSKIEVQAIRTGTKGPQKNG